MTRSAPAALLVARFLLGVILLAGAGDRRTGVLFVLALSAGVLFDALDGIIARRLGVANPRLRVADGWVDAWFFGCALVAAWLSHAAVLRQFLVPIGVMLALNLLSQLVAWTKYRRFTAYHAYTARAVGGLLYLAAVQLFGWGNAGWLLWVGIAAAILSHAERTAITLILPR